MKQEELYDGITQIRDDLILNAEQPAAKNKKRPRRFVWMGAVAAVLAVAILVGVLFNPWGSPLAGEAQALAAAVYPETVAYPNVEDYFPGWAEALQSGLEWDMPEEEREANSAAFGAALAQWEQSQRNLQGKSSDAPKPWGFIARSGRELLSAANPENKLYAPLNIYMGLAMLAEAAGGKTRTQLLSLLGADNMDSLRTGAKALWLANYRNDGAFTCVLANSLWLNKNLTYEKEAVDRLASDYYASVYRGEMGSAAYDKLLRSWLSEQTGGSLDDALPEIKTDPLTALMLASTVAYNAQWWAKFRPENTKSGVFHSVSGDVTVDYLYESEPGNYYWSEQFGAVSKPLSDGGSVWFLLPDAGVTPEQLATDPATWEFLEDPYHWGNQKSVTVRLTAPKLDLSVRTDLTGSLRRLGLTDVFDRERADFHPLLGEMEGVALEQAEQAVHFIMNEEGCQASACFILVGAGAMEPPEDHVDFTLDRPFLFVLKNAQGLPLFCGVVNQP